MRWFENQRMYWGEVDKLLNGLAPMHFITYFIHFHIKWNILLHSFVWVASLYTPNAIFGDIVATMHVLYGDSDEFNINSCNRFFQFIKYNFINSVRYLIENSVLNLLNVLLSSVTQCQCWSSPIAFQYVNL